MPWGVWGQLQDQPPYPPEGVGEAGPPLPNGRFSLGLPHPRTPPLLGRRQADWAPRGYTTDPTLFGNNLFHCFDFHYLEVGMNKRCALNRCSPLLRRASVQGSLTIRSMVQIGTHGVNCSTLGKRAAGSLPNISPLSFGFEPTITHIDFGGDSPPHRAGSTAASCG